MQTEDKIKLAKGVTKFVIRHSTGAIITQILRNNTAETTTRPEKIQYAVGAYVIGSLVSERVDAWTEKQFETAERLIAKVKSTKAPTPTE